MLNKWIVKLTEWNIYGFYIGGVKEEYYPQCKNWTVITQVKVSDGLTWELEIRDDLGLRRIDVKVVNWFLHYI